MIDLTNSEIKIIQYINRHPNHTYTQIYKKFPNFKDCCHRMESNGFIKSEDPNPNLMGNDYDDLDNPTTYTIGHSGIIFLESRKWLNTEYIVSHVVVPIMLAIISTLITLFLTNTLSKPQETNQQYQPAQEQRIPE